MIKIMQLGSSSGLYGAEFWILALIKHLNKAKIESVVATLKPTKLSTAPLISEAKKYGFKTKEFSEKNSFDVSIVRKIRNYINENAIDILHTHGYKTDIVGLFAVKGTKCKVISTPHGWTKSPDIKLWFYEMIDKLFLPFFDAVVPLSSELFKNLKKNPGVGGKLHLIKNGLDLSEIYSSRHIADAMTLWKKEGALVLGYIGRLTSGKGIDVIFKAMAKHGKENWRLAIIGNGEYRHVLEKEALNLKITDKLKFFGFRSDRLSFLKGFDIFILPSRSEGIPRCLMEAMAASVPVIASDIPGCRYLVEDNRTGLLFKVDDFIQLANNILKISSDIKLRNKFVQSGKTYIEEHFSADKMAVEYEKLYTKLIGKSLAFIQ